ncbi:MAG: histidine kinase [Dysgonamonadaceae bacterium]|nr:histidine kinase [Dysgonamonadaceae bacterium]
MNHAIFGKRTALHLSITISVIFLFIMIITFFFAKAREFGKGIHFFDLVTVHSLIVFFINVTILLYILFCFQFWIIKKYKREEKKGLLYAIVGSLLLLFVLSPLLSQIQWEFMDEHIPNNTYLIVQFFRDLIVLLITLLFTALLQMWENKQKVLMENQKLLMENLRNRYEALKNQIDPHFLFNSLNTLNGLIGYDDDKAHEYVDQLSLVFRYTMQNKPAILLYEELNFAESYIYLMKIRYNDSLQIEINSDEKYLRYYILPFGLQLLIENAIKHNVISKKYPLLITIETTENETIKVKNSLRLKPDNNSSGIGLANLNERYHLFFNKEIRITQDDDSFTVEIPLIKEIKKFDRKFNYIR